ARQLARHGERSVVPAGVEPRFRRANADRTPALSPVRHPPTSWIFVAVILFAGPDPRAVPTVATAEEANAPAPADPNAAARGAVDPTATAAPPAASTTSSGDRAASGDIPLLPAETPPHGATTDYKTDFSRHTVPYRDIISLGIPKDGIAPIISPRF